MTADSQILAGLARPLSGIVRMVMLSPEKSELLRRYAIGAVTWRELQDRGFVDYVEVLGGLGELGLRPPIAPMTGPNVAARERGIAIIREALRREAERSRT